MDKPKDFLDKIFLPGVEHYDAEMPEEYLVAEAKAEAEAWAQRAAAARAEAEEARAEAEAARRLRAVRDAISGL